MNMDPNLVCEGHAEGESGRILQAGVEGSAILVEDGA